METATLLDQMVSGEDIQIMKAALPYLAPQGQRFLSVMAKVLELQNTISIFRRSSDNDMRICSSPSSASPVDMLKDIQNCCSDATKEKIDQIINLYLMMEVMTLSQETPV